MSVALILGGARSGKSAHAERLITATPSPWLFLATAMPYDEEMADRIRVHRARRGDGWRTEEEELDLVGALRAAPPGRPVLVDSITQWVTNLMLAGRDVNAEVLALVEALAAHEGYVVLVSDEVGMSVVPESAMGRQFRDQLGMTNQRLAALADRVDFVAAGLPLSLKDRRLS